MQNGARTQSKTIQSIFNRHIQNIHAPERIQFVQVFNNVLQIVIFRHQWQNKNIKIKIKWNGNKGRERSVFSFILSFFLQMWRWVCLELQPQNVLKTRHTTHTGIVSKFVVVIVVLWVRFFRLSVSRSLGCCIYAYTYTLCVFFWHSLTALLSLSNFISFCPSIRLNIFHPKCQIKVRIFYRNNNRSASIVRLNNGWKVSMKCGRKGFKKTRIKYILSSCTLVWPLFNAKKKHNKRKRT